METVLAQTCTDTGKTQLFLLFSLPPRSSRCCRADQTCKKLKLAPLREQRRSRPHQGPDPGSWCVL